MRPSYQVELERLYRSYSQCISREIVGLKDCIDTLSSYSLIAVGSGGSYPVAHFISDLHQYYTGEFASAKTPLEFASELPPSRSAMVIVSAGGQNPDAVMALKAGLRSDIKEIVIVTGAAESALSRLARKYRHIHLITNTISPYKDGFLATNWSLTTSVLFLLHYMNSNTKVQASLPSNLEDLIHPKLDKYEFRERLSIEVQKLDSKQFISILYGGWTKTAAIDLESRFVESGFYTPQLADIRNFAHGRHQWLVQKGDSTGIIILDYPSLKPLTDRTASLLPESIPKIRLGTSYGGPIAGLATLMLSIFLLGSLATIRGLDPANPNVPLWCRKIYNTSHKISPTERKEHIIEMKIGLRYNELESKRWHEFLSSEIEHLNSATIRAAVIDLDGTLVDSKDRFLPLSTNIKEQMNKLLSQGMTIGIATGRGKSAGSILREATKKEFHKQLRIGYYNCAEILPLTEEVLPSYDNSLLSEALDTFEGNVRSTFNDKMEIERRTCQISLAPTNLIGKQRLWKISQEMIAGNGLPLKAMMSGHSIDIVEQRLSKTRMVEFLEGLVRCEGNEVLRIGDKGAWPGNDFELLNHRLGLSVNEVSSDTERCWNIGNVGEMGATLATRYLSWLKLTGGGEWHLKTDL